MYWSSKELLESNNLLAGWSGFEPESTPLQSNTITADKHCADMPMTLITCCWHCNARLNLTLNLNLNPLKSTMLICLWNYNPTDKTPRQYTCGTQPC